MGVGELGHNVVNIILHPVEDCCYYGLRAVAPGVGIPVDLLNPLQIHNGYQTNQQIHMLGNVERFADHASMQSLVKQQVSIWWYRTPRRKRTGFMPCFYQRLIFIMHIPSVTAVASISVVV